MIFRQIIIGYAIYLTFENFRKTLLESEQAISNYLIDNYKVDTFYDIAFPGGIHLDWLTKNWGVLDYILPITQLYLKCMYIENIQV